jgi:3'(2'), 5'-bisphosphate nucleotidase
MSAISPDSFDAINHLIRDCGKQSLANEDFQVFEKGINDYVTSVDRALDVQLTHGFQELFPTDGIITEENSASWQAFHDGRSRLWCIDPIDGTDDFIHGRPHYALMVGLLEQSQPTAGWIYAPAFDRLWYGDRRQGLFEQIGDYRAVPLLPKSPPLTTDYCPIQLGYKDRKCYGEAIAQRIPGVAFQSIGSFGLKVLEVIQGRAGLYVYLNGRVKLWDTTGPIALAQAAGLVCCDLYGKPLRFTPDAVDSQTLAHQQAIVIGWSHYVEALRSPLQAAVESVQ